MKKLKTCIYCGKIHPSGYKCEKKPKRKKTGGREAEWIRNTYRWQKTREKIKDRDYYLCAYCLAHGKITYSELEVHHIVPIEERPDLAYEEDNLITLCEKDHEAAEKGKISRQELMDILKHPPRVGIKQK